MEPYQLALLFWAVGLCIFWADYRLNRQIRNELAKCRALLDLIDEKLFFKCGDQE